MRHCFDFELLDLSKNPTPSWKSWRRESLWKHSLWCFLLVWKKCHKDNLSLHVLGQFFAMKSSTVSRECKVENTGSQTRKQTKKKTTPNLLVIVRSSTNSWSATFSRSWSMEKETATNYSNQKCLHWRQALVQLAVQMQLCCVWPQLERFHGTFKDQILPQLFCFWSHQSSPYDHERWFYLIRS